MNIEYFIKAERESTLHQLEKEEVELHQKQRQVELDLEYSFPVKYRIDVDGAVNWTDMPLKEEIQKREISLKEPIRRACEKFKRSCSLQKIKPENIKVYAVLESGTEIPIPSIFWENFL